MADKIKKALAALTAKERAQVKEILNQLLAGKNQGLNLAKLKGSKDIFRVRKGKIRIIFRKQNTSVKVLKIDRRSKDAYKNIK